MYNYFRTYVRNNRLQIEACYSARAHYHDVDDHDHSLDMDTDGFYTFLYYGLIMLASIGAIGALYDIHHYFKTSNVTDDDTDDAYVMKCWKTKTSNSRPPLVVGRRGMSMSV